MKTKDLFMAYEEGKEAAFEGALCVNPFPKNTEEARYWNKGYMEVYSEGYKPRAAEVIVTRDGD